MASNWIQNIVARQTSDSNDDTGSDGKSPVKTTLIFAVVLGGLLGLFVIFAFLSFLKSKFGLNMPLIPAMPDPPAYLSIFGRRRNPEDVPPLPLYMEQPDGSTTVLQRSESRRTRGNPRPSSEVPSDGEPTSDGLPRPPPYMKEPIPNTDTPLSSSVSLQLPGSPTVQAPTGRNARNMNRSRTT